MNILMLTNTYLPHVGGVANSVSAFTQQLQNRGHQVVVVAPTYEDAEQDEDSVIRIPAIQHFNGSDFSVVLAPPGYLVDHLKDFKPEIVHSHHPFLIGSTAVRISAKFDVPLVYTQHTMFENYTHYVPAEMEQLKQFVIGLSTGYANLADQVIAPSQSVAEILTGRGVETPIETIPTGIDVARFADGDGARFRAVHHIPHDVFVVGHIGRLAPEKNLDFLTEAVGLFLKQKPNAHFVIVGYGSSEPEMKTFFDQKGPHGHVHFCGKQKGQDLIDAYHAMDVFAFSSKSETQGMVLAEAMAAGKPVVALDASGVREVVNNEQNGYLLYEEDATLFAAALSHYHDLSDRIQNEFKLNAEKTAEGFSLDICVSKLVSVYERLKGKSTSAHSSEKSSWEKALEQIHAEWELLTNMAKAVGHVLKNDNAEQ